MANDERPIIFGGPMVRALLAGTKTQTRRIVKPQPIGFHGGVRLDCHTFVGIINGPKGIKQHPVDHCWNSPYGRAGDRLWVRETWQIVKSDANPPKIWYRADPGVEDCVAKSLIGWAGWRSPIHLPREACRLLLEVTGVRVERLQEISESDAAAEGIEPRAAFGESTDPRRYHYRCLWDSLNAKRAPWASNPWVWVIEFRKAP